MTALMWLAHERTGLAQWPAILAAVQIGPTFFLGPWGGMLADRWPRRQLIACTQSAFLLAALVLFGLYLSDSLSIEAMLAVMFVHGVIQALDIPARLAFIPGLVGRNDLANAVALNSLLFNVARAIGPAIAGVLLATGGAEWCFAFNTFSYFAVLLALFLMRLPPAELSTSARTPGGGFRVLARQPGMLTLVLLAGLVAIGGWPLLPLLPAYAAKVLDLREGGYGTLLSAVGIGALLAALTAATIGGDVRRKVLLGGGLVLVCLALIGLSATRVPWVATGCCGLFGFGMILFFATGQTAIQLGTADADRGKVMGVWAMMLSAGVPLGNLVFGPAADAFDVPTVLACQAAAIALAAGVLAIRRV